MRDEICRQNSILFAFRLVVCNSDILDFERARDVGFDVGQFEALSLDLDLVGVAAA